MRDGHVRLRQLADLRDGVLAPRVRAEVEAHLASGCAACAARRDTLGRTLSALRVGPLPAPPRDSVRDAKRMFAARRWAALLDRAADVVARLVAPPQSAPVFALRADGGTRRLLFVAGDHDIDVEVTETGGRAALRGRIARLDGADAGPCTIELWCDGRAAGRTADGASFEFSGLRAGTYALSGTLGERTFRAMPIVVGRDGAGAAS